MCPVAEDMGHMQGWALKAAGVGGDQLHRAHQLMLMGARFLVREVICKHGKGEG